MCGNFTTLNLLVVCGALKSITVLYRLCFFLHEKEKLQDISQNFNNAQKSYYCCYCFGHILIYV